MEAALEDGISNVGGGGYRPGESTSVTVGPTQRRENAGRQERSVGHLQDLYAVVVAIALSLAVDRLVSTSSGFHDRRLLLFVALLVTLVPFYHGALRHLDEEYAFGSSGSRRQALVLLDFWILFLESCAFLALAVSLGRPRVYAIAFLALLVFDLAWTGVTTAFAGDNEELVAQSTWGRINAGAAVVMALALAITAATGDSNALWYVTPAVAIGRTLADYGRTWSFYVGSD